MGRSAEIPPCDSCHRLYVSRQPALLVEGGVQMRLCGRCMSHASQFLAALESCGGRIIPADSAAAEEAAAQLDEDEVMLRRGRWNVKHGFAADDREAAAQELYATGVSDDIDLHLARVDIRDPWTGQTHPPLARSLDGGAPDALRVIGE